MISWDYNEKEYIEESQARLIPAGDHKVRIDGGRRDVQQSGSAHDQADPEGLR